MVSFGTNTNSDSAQLRNWIKQIIQEAGSLEGAKSFIDDALSTLDISDQIVNDTVNTINDSVSGLTP